MRGTSNDSKMMSKYEDLMKDIDFDPFGSFTISELKTAKLYKNEQIPLSMRTYYEEVVSKTKDDPSTFDPKQFCIDTNGSIFSCKNVIQLQKQLPQSVGGQKDNNLFFLKFAKSLETVNNEDKRQQYLYLLKVRSLLFQPCSAQQCFTQQRGEVYMFGAFEVYDLKELQKEMIIFFDFKELRITYIQSTSQKSLRFEQIKGANAAFNEDEIYLSTIDQADRKIKVKYRFQRDLLVEYFSLAVENKKGEATDFKMKRSSLNLIKEDNIVPPKQILSYKVQIKTKSGEKRIVDFTVGMNNIVVHEFLEIEGMEQAPTLKKNKNMQPLIDSTYRRQVFVVIHNIIPFNQKYFYVECNSEPNQLICKQEQESSSFFFESELEASNVKEALKAVYNRQILNDQIYIHIPEMKKQELSSAKSKSERFLKEKSKQLGIQIDHHKHIIQLLLRARCFLDLQGEKMDYDYSEGQGLNNSLNEDFVQCDNNSLEDENAYDADDNSNFNM